jgi:hypothetical protein
LQENDSRSRVHAAASPLIKYPGNDFKTIHYFCALMILNMGTEELNLSRHLTERMEQRNISLNWILETVRIPDKEEHVDDDEIHFFKIGEQFSNKCLKVVVNPVEKIIVTAHFDRIKTRKGLK